MHTQVTRREQSMRSAVACSWRSRRSSHAHSHAATPPALENWDDVFGVLELDSKAQSTIVRSRLTMAATVAYALRKLPPSELGALSASCGRGRDGRLLLWIVGAREAMEGELARGGHLAGPLAALSPPSLGSRGLELVLIGPEMSTWELERTNPVDPSARSILIRARSGTLHALHPSPSAAPDDAPPDLVVLFNSGIGTLLWPLVEHWLPTIALLLNLRVPLLCTSFNEHEARGEEALLGGPFGTTYLLPSQQNPFAHSTPLAAVASACADDAAAESTALQAVVAAEAAAAAAAATVDAAPTGTAARASPSDATRSNSWIKWVVGSSNDAAALAGPAQAKARDLIRTCAKMFALKNMDAWLEELNAGEALLPATNRCVSVGPQEALVSRAETVAANVMLLAEATADTGLALMAYKKGAVEALNRFIGVRGEAPFASTTAAGESASKPVSNGPPRQSYTGVSALERVHTGAATALRNIHSAVAEARKLELPPEDCESLLPAGPAAYRNVFKGQWINMRSAPSMHGAIVARLPPDATVTAEAARGDWLRLCSDEHSAGVTNTTPAPETWVLVRHPVHGTLLEPV